MFNDTLKAAEKRGYGRGYRAGAKRRQAEISAAHRRAQENAFWQRALLAAIPAAMTVENWKINDEPVTSGEARMRLASIWADHALNLALTKGRIR